LILASVARLVWSSGLLAKHLRRAAFGERGGALRIFLCAVDMKLVATHAPTPCKIWRAIYHDPDT
jgi:hypothetical protein